MIRPAEKASREGRLFCVRDLAFGDPDNYI